MYTYQIKKFSQAEPEPAQLQPILNNLGVNDWYLVDAGSVFEKTSRSIVYKAEKFNVYEGQLIPTFNTLGA